MMRSDYLYPIAALDDVLGWMREVLPSLDRSMEPLVFMRRDMFDHAGPGLLVTGPVLTDSREQAIEVLRPLETCPALSKAIRRDANVATEFDELLQGGEDMFYPRGGAMRPTTCGPARRRRTLCRGCIVSRRRCRRLRPI